MLVTRRLPREALELLRARCRVELHDSASVMPRARLLSRVRGKDGLLCLLTEKVDAELLCRAPRLRAVATCSVGYDHVDLGACRSRGVAVTHTPDALTETVADFAWALLLAAARRVVEADAFLRAGRYRAWDPLLLLGADVHGKTLGVVGFGRIGRAVARRAAGFSMRVLYHDPRKVPGSSARRVTLDRLLRESDFVSLHCSLKPGARHLIDARALGRMKRSAFLINTSRGPVVDEAALVKALKSGRLAGAALDVYEREPRVAPGLSSLPNVVLAPHIASASRETRTKMALMAARGLLDSLAGRRSPYRL